MKAETKVTLFNVLGSPFSNARVVECGKTLPWWSALICFILGVFLPIIPTMVSISNSYGSQFLTSNTYGYDVQLVGSTMDIYLNGYEFSIDDEHELSATKDGVKYSPSAEQDILPIFQYINSETSQVDFEVYYTIRSTRGSSTLDDLLDVIVAKTYISGTAIEGTTDDLDSINSNLTSEEETKTLYRPSFIIFYPSGVYTAIYKPTTTTLSTSGGGDWKHHEATNSLLQDYLTVTVSETTYVPSVENQTTLMKTTAYIDGAFDNWKQSFNLSYLTSKDNTLLYSTLIFEAIYIGLAFFMGLMIFLLTRGKKNYYRYLSFFTCQKINAWSCFCPGLLAMILGFILPNYAVMFFIILLGLRTMWLSMRQLRPQY